jgi:hypothetical protein
MNNDLLKKLKDPKFYLEKLVKIKGKTPGLVPFVLNEAQKDLFNALKKNNRVIILKARQIGFCLDENTKILLSNLSWVKLKDVKVGDEIVAVDENIPAPKKQRKMRTAVVEKKFELEVDTLKITFSDGRELIATPEHKLLSKKWECSTDTIWRKVSDMRVGTSIRSITMPWEEGGYEDGWFGGMIDGEGCISKPSRSGVQLAVSQVAGEVYNRLSDYVNNSGVTSRVEIDKRKTGDSGKLGSKEVYKIIINKMNDLFLLFGKTRPCRLRKNWWEGKAMPNDGWTQIVKIEKFGKSKVIDLQTSCHTYIAEGIVSHNSTAAIGFLYHKTIMTPGTNTAIIGYNAPLTAELLDKVKTFWKSTPAELRPVIKYNSKNEISFPNTNSKIIVLPSTENVGRGYTLHNVLLTELSAWDKAEDKMMSLEASVPVDGLIVIESTPRGQGNLFHKMFVEDNGYLKKEYGWWWHYSEEEIETIRKRMNNPMRFAQEYGLEFLASGRSVFDQNMIRDQRKNVLNVGDKNGEWIVSEDRGLRIYSKINPGDMYVFGVDTSEGIEGGDYSTVTVWNRRTGEEAGFYRGLIQPDKLGTQLNEWGRKFNNALMVVEVNNHGLTTLTVLKQLMYPTLYFRRAQFETIGEAYSDRLGWKTTKLTRPLLMDDLSQAVRDNLLIIHSKETLDEMSVFIYDKNNNMVPSGTAHDDCIFSAAIGYQGFKVMYDKELTQIDYTKHINSEF